MIVTIGGTPGAGKTTISKLLEEKLGYKHHYMGGVMRDIARKRGITLNELDVLRQNGPEIDNEVDAYVVELGKSKDNIVLDSWTGAHFIPHAIKVFMECSPEIGAERIFKDIKEKGQGETRNEKLATTIEEQTELIKKRKEGPRKIYKELYNFDIYDMSNYDLCIDTSNLTPDQVADKIIEFINDFKDIN